MQRLSPRCAPWLGLLSVLAVLLLPRVAWAQHEFGTVTLDLHADDAPAPTHLCVVSTAEGPRTRETLWDALEPTDDRDARSKAEGTWLVRPAVWGGTPASANRHLCAEGPGDCRPRVELPAALEHSSELFVGCTADTLVESDPDDEGRPLFVLLEHLEGSPPRIDAIRLTGGVATVTVAGDLGAVVVTARSLGGYYRPHRVSVRAETEGTEPAPPSEGIRKHVTLELQPRCRLAEVTLPGTRLVKADRERLSVTVHGQAFDVDRCVEGDLDDTTVLQVRVPPAPLSVGSIEIELAPRADGRAAAKYGASYHTTWPTTPFPLTFKQVTFHWRRPACIFPASTCPVATLENGTTCDAAPTDEGCTYVCPGTAGEDALDLKLPLGVSFEKSSPTQKWEDKLAQNGQTLTSYVPSDQYYVQANVEQWRHDAPANRVWDVEVYTEDGTIQKRGVVGVTKLQLRVPGASCEPLRYRPVGDRQYVDSIAHVSDGEIDFGNPDRLAKRVSFNAMVAIGGGPAWSDLAEQDSTPPIYLNGLGMFALQFRSRQKGWRRFGWEFRLGATLGRWGELITDSSSTTAGSGTGSGTGTDTSSGGVDTTTPSSSQNEQRFAQTRLLGEPGVVFAAHDRVDIGVGWGFGASFPIREQNDLTRDRIRFINSPSLDGRFWVRGCCGIIAQTRAVFGEQAFGRRKASQATTTHSEAKARSLLVLIGAVFRL